MAKGLTLQELQAMGAKPTGGLTLEQLQGAQPNHLNGFEVIDKRDFFQKAADAIKASPLGFTAPLGEAIGNSVGGLAEAGKSVLKGDLKSAGEVLRTTGAENIKNAPKAIGSTIASATLPASFAVAAPATVVGAAAEYGGLSAAQAAGESLSKGNDLPTAGADALKAGLIGGAVGSAFNLLGKALSKAGPSALSFTSGVPKNAIEQASANPGAAKAGLSMNVADVRAKAVTSLQSLHKDLGSEFSQGLKQIADAATAPPDAQTVASTILQKTQSLTDKLGVSLKPGATGLQAIFDKSAIVKPGEQSAVQAALDTISNWDDFTAAGMQKLSERVGALRNFDSSGVTRSSAIVGKIYNAVGDAIKESYPQLSQLRTNYAANRKVLDEIGNVLSATKEKPTQVQAAVSRLDNLFKENKDEYLNAIKQLSERSGVDYLSLLAGGEFQKVLPGFVRGLGGGGAVGVGASLLNPYLLLLAPLFSPRVAGVISRNAPAVAKTAAPIVRGLTTQAIPALTQGSAPQ